MGNKIKHKSKRLTIELRDEIVHAISNETFKKRGEKFKRDSLAFYDLCYKTRYTPSQIKSMLEFPESKRAFQYSLLISNHFGGRISSCEKMSEVRPFWKTEPDNITCWAMDHPLSVRWRELNDHYNALMSDKRELMREIRSVIRPCNTTKQLISAWPEAEYWLERVRAFDETAPVPMKNPEKLNTLICTLKE